MKIILICLILQPQFLVRLGCLRARRRIRLSDSLLHPRMKRRAKDSTGSAEAGMSREREEPIRLAVVINTAGTQVRIR